MKKYFANRLFSPYTYFLNKYKFFGKKHNFEKFLAHKSLRPTHVKSFVNFIYYIKTVKLFKLNENKKKAFKYFFLLKLLLLNYISF